MRGTYPLTSYPRSKQLDNIKGLIGCVARHTQSEGRFHAFSLPEQLFSAAHPVWFIAGTKTFLPTLTDRPNFQPLHQPHTVPEILVPDPGERLLARPVDFAEQRFENHVLYLRPVPITEPGPQPPALEAFRTIFREVFG